MYPITLSTSCLISALFCYLGAAEPPPAHGYGPPSPVQFDSNEMVGSHERYDSPVDFGNYASFSSGSPTGYSHPSGGYAKTPATFGGGGSGAYGGGGPSRYKSGKGGASSSYISVVHGPGGTGSPANKPRLHGAYTAAAKPAAVTAFHGANFGTPSAFAADGKFGSSNAYANQVPSFGGGSGGGSSAAFGKLFGSGSSFGGAAFDFGGGGGGGSGADYGKGYEGGASDEVGSYSSGGPSYATFTGSKPSFSPSFGQHGSRGNAYSTSNINFGGGGGGGGGKASGHGGFHPASFAANFKPSGTKTYNRYHAANGGHGSGSGSGSAGFASSPLVGSESGYNSRALKAGYTVDGADHSDSGEDTNPFSSFGDGAGFKVQSSYSTG